MNLTKADKQLETRNLQQLKNDDRNMCSNKSNECFFKAAKKIFSSVFRLRIEEKNFL